jgi:hypothetical protein
MGESILKQRQGEAMEKQKNAWNKECSAERQNEHGDVCANLTKAMCPVQVRRPDKFI